MREEAKEPSLADVLEAVTSLSQRMDGFSQRLDNMATKDDLEQLEMRLLTLENRVYDMKENMLLKSDFNLFAATTNRDINTLGNTMEAKFKAHEKRMVYQLQNIVLSAQQINELSATLDALVRQTKDDEDR